MSIKKSELKALIGKGIIPVVCFKKQYKVRVRTVEKITEYYPSQEDPEGLNRLVKWAVDNGRIDEDELVMEVSVSKLKTPIVLLEWDKCFAAKPKLNDLIITYKGTKGWAIPQDKFKEQLEEELMNLETDQ